MREIHVAGDLIAFVQRCRRCGAVLTDYRDSMVPDGTPPLNGFATGAHVEIERGWPTSFTVTDDAPTCVEKPTA